jgi:hypothetical protein
MKTRPVWEQGESTQLPVVSRGSRLEGYFDCSRFIFQDASFSASSITALSQSIVPVRMLLEPNIIYLLWQWTPRCLNPLLYECAVIVPSALTILLWLFMPQECTMCQKSRRIRYTLIIFNFLWCLCFSTVDMLSRLSVRMIIAYCCYISSISSGCLMLLILAHMITVLYLVEHKIRRFYA